MKLLKIKEVALILKIDKITTYKYAKEGTIPAIRIGRNWRFLEEVLEEWLTQKAGKEIVSWHKEKAEKKDEIYVM